MDSQRECKFQGKFSSTLTPVQSFLDMSTELDDRSRLLHFNKYKGVLDLTDDSRSTIDEALFNIEISRQHNPAPQPSNKTQFPDQFRAQFVLCATPTVFLPLQCR